MSNFRYEVHFEEARARAITKAYMRLSRNYLRRRAIADGLREAILKTILVFIPTYLAITSIGLLGGLMVFVGVTLLWTVLLTYMGTWNMLSKYRKSTPSWIFEIRQDGWVCEFPNGREIVTPWHAITLTAEAPEIYLIEVEGEELMVDRQSLADAGLDELFRARVAGAME